MSNFNEIIAVIPDGMEQDGPNFGLSPGIIANGFMFISGQLGLDQEGIPPVDPAQQASIALENIGKILKKAGCTFADVVRIETFHVGSVSDVNRWFIPVKKPFFKAPFPSWTAIGVTNLAVEGAIIEISAIVKLPG